MKLVFLRAHDAGECQDVPLWSKLLDLVRNLHLSRARIALLTALVALIGSAIPELQLLLSTPAARIDAAIIDAGPRSLLALATNSGSRSGYLLSLDVEVSFPGKEQTLMYRFAPVREMPVIEPGNSREVRLVSTGNQEFRGNLSDIEKEYAAAASSCRVSWSYRSAAGRQYGETEGKACTGLDAIARDAYAVLKRKVKE